MPIAASGNIGRATMQKNYWTKILSQRLSRRRTLAMTGAGALGAAFLAACGGDDDDGAEDTGSEGSSGLAYKPVDTTKNAQKGGVMVGAFSNEPLNYDPLSSSSQFTFNHAHHAYQRFFSLKSGTIDEAASGEPEGDAVSSWEYSPDGLTLTMKLRPNTKFDQRPPTNSRVMNSADVKWSWERFVALQPGSRFFMNSLNPDAPVDSITYPDANTVVVKQAFKSGAMLKMFGTIYYFAILPVRSEEHTS